jgi:protein disulfide-isomerase/protein disulfide-isomerase A6
METITSSKSIKGGRRRRRRHPNKHKTQKRKSKSGLVAYGKIYADWCGHCITLKPEWAKLERAMLPMRSHNIESANKDELIDQFNRKFKTDLPKSVGFPTIFKLTHYGGKIEIYEGERTASNMIAWLSEHKPKPKKFLGLF